VLQIVAERLQVVVAGEVALTAGPGGDGIHHPADELLHAALALGRPHLAAEILRDDDVCGLLGPEAGNFDVALLENDRALLVADHRRAGLPFDLVEGIDPRAAEEPLVFEPGRPRGLPARHRRHVCSSDALIHCPSAPGHSGPPRATALIEQM
jgi:hypothetical protein